MANMKGMDLINVISFVFTLFTGISRSNSDAVKVWKEYLVYFIRALTPNMRYSERFEYLLSASARGGDYSRNFAAFGIECIAKAIGIRNPLLTEELFSRSGAFTLEEGQSISLTKGESTDDHFYTVEKINGIFTVKQQGRHALIAVDARNFLLQHDLKKKLFILCIGTIAGIKARKREEYNLMTDGVVGTISLINKLISANTDFAYKVDYSSSYHFGDHITYIDENGEEQPLARIYYPWAGKNLIANHLNGRRLEIHYIETYNLQKGGETIVICGEYK